MTIKEEYNLSKKYYIETEEFEGKLLAKLSLNNVAKVEAIIKTDSSYSNSSNKKAEPKGKYKGSSAYWFEKLNNILKSNSENKILKNIPEAKNVICNIVNAIDRENSTHLNADNIGREQISNRLLTYSIKDLYYYLRETADLHLFNKISEKTHGGNGRNRSNPSFASKFCHYACFYLLEGEPEQDNYSIYDSVIKSVISLYANRYNVNLHNINLNDYVSYRKTIDDIIKNSNSKISRNGFDHLLWYFHKGKKS